MASAKADDAATLIRHEEAPVGKACAILLDDGIVDAGAVDVAADDSTFRIVLRDHGGPVITKPCHPAIIRQRRQAADRIVSKHRTARPCHQHVFGIVGVAVRT